MFVIDYLKSSESNTVVVPPFHSGHLGLIPRSASQTITLLRSARNLGGCELCVTPYEQPLEHLFRLKCILKEQAGVVHRLLRAIAAMEINILSWESATLESNGGHGVFMLLDWSTTSSPTKVELPKNLHELFSTRLSGIIPFNDIRYIRLLRQILGQCADILLWEKDPNHDFAFPRLRLNEFEEKRLVARRGSIAITPATDHPVHLEEAGVAFTIHPGVAAEARLATGRDNGGTLHYIMVSDIESKTLRIFIPRSGREKRMIHLAFSHKNRPGALCAITDVIARSQFSIVSGLVRKLSDERNILEVTLEHQSRELSREDLDRDSSAWARAHLRLDDKDASLLLRHYEVILQAPLYPRSAQFSPAALFDEAQDPPELVTLISPEEAEDNLMKMAERAKNEPEFAPRRWLTDLLFAGDWGPTGKPSIFLSYSRSGADQAAAVISKLGDRFHFRVMQSDGDSESSHITGGSIERIVHAHYFIGIWHPEGRRSLSPWMHFEYGVALSHHKPSVILSHRDIPKNVVDRIDRDSRRIEYYDLRTEPGKLADLERRCESWWLSHRRLSL